MVVQWRRPRDSCGDSGRSDELAVTERLKPPDRSRFQALLPKDIETISEGVPIGRIYSISGPYPTTWAAYRSFGPTTARFDHHPPPPRDHHTFSVFYASTPHVANRGQDKEPSLKICLAEAYQHNGVIDLHRDDPYFAIFKFNRPVQLLNVADSDWLTRAGGNAALTSGNRGPAREWARALHAHYSDQVDGIFYASSLVPSGYCVALWETALDAMPSHPTFNRPLSDAALRTDIESFASLLGFNLIS